MILPTDFTVETFAKCNKALKIIDPSLLLKVKRNVCHLTSYLKGKCYISIPIHCKVLLGLLYTGFTAVSVGTTKTASVDTEFIIYNPLYNPKTEDSDVLLSKESLANLPV